MLTEISQTEKDKYYMILLICETLKKQNKQIKQNKTETDSEIQRTS